MINKTMALMINIMLINKKHYLIKNCDDHKIDLSLVNETVSVVTPAPFSNVAFP